jgi:hypothetical protein
VIRTYADPISAELRAFPRAVGEEAARQAVGYNRESNGESFRTAGTVVGKIATGQSEPDSDVQLSQMGIARAELSAIQQIEYIREGTVDAVAERFCRQYGYLIGLIAGQIAAYGGKVELL